LVDVDQGGHGEGPFSGLSQVKLVSRIVIGGIKNIRFTNQFFRSMVRLLPEESGGDFGWFRRVAGPILASQTRGPESHVQTPNLRTDWRLTMNANIPVLPIAGGTLVRAFLALLALVTRWLKEFARVRRHRRDVRVLAGLDRRMLADIGLTRSDLSDAFSEPFWDDPTMLLHERAIERRMSRAVTRAQTGACVENGFHRPPTDRPARQAI
jgi:uncharacterized protein YjiS (DUF1127 family)